MKLPDFYEYVKFDYDDDYDSCPTWCLKNCSCLAYAYVDGIGCLVWSEGILDIQEFSYGGQNLFLRLAHDELGEINAAALEILCNLNCSFHFLFFLCFLFF